MALGRILGICVFMSGGMCVGIAHAQQNVNEEQNKAQIRSSGENKPQNERGQGVSQLSSDPDKMQHNSLWGFAVNPAMSLVEYYDDNIFYARERPKDDLITVISPSLALNSKWQKHALNIQGGANIGRYDQHRKENYNDYFAGFDGRIDLTSKKRIFGGMQYNMLHEGRESPDDVLGTKPTKYTMLDVFAGSQLEFNSFGLKLGLTMQDYNFDDVAAAGSIINNDDRDRREYELGLRFVKPWKKNVQIFAQSVFGKRNYNDPVDDAGYNRDSKGTSLAAGVLLHPKKNLDIEVLAGGLWQNYDDRALSDIGAVDFGAIVGWRPSAYTSVNFNLDRRVKETTLAGASGYINTVADIHIKHDLTQDLSLNAGANFTENNYEGVDRTDDIIGFDAGGRYYFLPNIYGGLSYAFLHRDSDLAGQDFYNNSVMLRLGANLNGHKPRSGLPSGFGTKGSFYGGVQEAHGSVFTALDGPRGSSGTVTADLGDHGTASGVFLGYDRMFGRWFMGAEMNAEKSVDFDLQHIQSGDRVFDVSRKNSYGFSLRGGYRQANNVAYYGSAGPVWTGFNTNYATAGNTYNRDKTEFGFRFGGGMEVPVIGSTGFLRMDYSYATYKDYGMVLPSGTDLFDNSEALLRLGFVVRSGVDKAQKQDIPAHDFDGFYIGSQLGYGGFAARNRGARNAGSFLTVDRGSHGGTGGLFAGYGMTPFKNVYLGVESEAEVSYADWNIDRDPTGRTYSARKDWTLGGALRAGYIFNDTVLLYGRLGGVYSQFNTDYARGNHSVDQTDGISGIRYGGGVEAAATKNVFVRMDYSYTDYKSYSVNYVTGVDSFNPTETLVRLGIGYRF